MEKGKTCTYNGQNYSEGSVTCQNNKEYVCQDGQWNPTGKDCHSAEQISESRQVEVLLDLLEKADTKLKAPMGACKWVSPQGPKCQQTSVVTCMQIGGSWLGPGSRC